MDLRLGFISLDDYLQTIARVYDSYLSSPERDRLSLIEASERRWTTSSSLVYDKGMLVAFIYDMSLRKMSDCQTSLDDVYRDLFRLPATGQRNANETILGVLTGRGEMKTFAGDYVERAAVVNLDAILPAYGIQLVRDSGATKLTLAHNVNQTQRKLLSCAGLRR
jgi:predicted metalloprotease with PDZ domain